MWSVGLEDHEAHDGRGGGGFVCLVCFHCLLGAVMLVDIMILGEQE